MDETWFDSWWRIAGLVLVAAILMRAFIGTLGLRSAIRESTAVAGDAIVEILRDEYRREFHELKSEISSEFHELKSEISSLRNEVSRLNRQ